MSIISSAAEGRGGAAAEGVAKFSSRRKTLGGQEAVDDKDEGSDSDEGGPVRERVLY